MSFKVIDVKGDGNCYYRCIWNIVKDDEELAAALCIEECDNEDIGAQEIRDYVASSIKYEAEPKSILRNLLEMYKECKEIEEYYPVLKRIDCNDEFDDICANVAGIIEDSSIMASSLEHEIIAARLATTCSYNCAADLKLIVLTQDPHESKVDLVEKWTEQLYRILPTVGNSRVAMIVNIDNIHYKYGCFLGQTVIDKHSFETHIRMVYDASDSE